jgi:hypothetical protein
MTINLNNIAKWIFTKDYLIRYISDKDYVIDMIFSSSPKIMQKFEALSSKRILNIENILAVYKEL